MARYFIGRLWAPKDAGVSERMAARLESAMRPSSRTSVLFGRGGGCWLFMVFQFRQSLVLTEAGVPVLTDSADCGFAEFHGVAGEEVES